MTRPLTLADRRPEPGDLVTTSCRIDPVTVTEVFPLVRAWRALEIAGMLNASAHWHYIRRADAGPTEAWAAEAVAR